MRRLAACAVAALLVLPGCGDEVPEEGLDSVLLDGEGDTGGGDVPEAPDPGVLPDVPDDGPPAQDPGPPAPDPGPPPDSGGHEGPHLVVEPAVVTFASTKIGVTQTASFVVRNDGTDKVNITDAVFETGKEEGFSFVLDQPTGLMVPGEKRTVDMKFTSAVIGSHTATIRFDTLPAVAAVTVFLKAVVSLQVQATAELRALPAAVRFGPVKVGKSSNIELDLVNMTTDALKVESIGWVAESPDISFVAPAVPILLGSGSKVKVSTTYAPGASGADAALLRVVTDSDIAPLLTVPMTGSGFEGSCAGKLVCSPAVLDLGTVAPGGAGGGSIVCRNEGLGPVEVKEVTATLAEGDGFSWLAPELPVSLPSGGAVAVAVGLVPPVEGKAAGEVTVTSDDCAAAAQKVTVQASAAAPSLPPCGILAGAEPELAWEWKADDGFGRVVSTPIVLDVDLDGTPDVVFVGHDKGSEPGALNDDAPGVLRAVRGNDAALVWKAEAAPSWRSGLAAAQLDGSPGPEIVAVAYEPSPQGRTCPGVTDVIPAPYCSKYLTGRLLCFEGASGALLWTSEPFDGATTDLLQAGAPTIADVNGDGLAEVVLGNTVYRGLDGGLLFAGGAGRGTEGHGFVTSVVDVDSDGEPEIVAGNTAYNGDGTIQWTATVGDTSAAAAADLDQDGDIEVFVNGPNGNSIVVDGKTGQTVHGPVNTGLIGCCASPPAVGDVTTTNPGLEIVTVGDDQLKVLASDLSVLWAVPVVDPDGAAGPAIFDVDGNGVAEIIYADRETVRVLRGANGEVLSEWPRAGTLGLDGPVVADVDGDGRAEILATADGGPEGVGLRLYADPAGQWVGTRRIWNQHAYVIRGVYDNGSVPLGAGNPSIGALLLRANAHLCQ